MCVDLSSSDVNVAQHLLNFDELRDGYGFRTRSQPYEHLGITILGGGLARGSVPRVFSPSTGTATPPHALYNDPEFGSEFGSMDQDIVIDLDGYTANHVRVYVGLAETAIGGDVTAEMVAYRKIETAHGVGAVRELAGAISSVTMLIFGSGDYRRSLGARPDRSRDWERCALHELLLAARMHDCLAIDSVYFHFRDREGLLQHARIARDLGFDGKTCIHPIMTVLISRGVRFWASSITTKRLAMLRPRMYASG